MSEQVERHYASSDLIGAIRAGRTERPPLGLHLVMGPDFLKMAENVSRNLGEERIKLIEIACRRG